MYAWCSADYVATENTWVGLIECGGLNPDPSGQKAIRNETSAITTDGYSATSCFIG